jgi:acid phosphatase (class A)
MTSIRWSLLGVLVVLTLGSANSFTADYRWKLTDPNYLSKTQFDSNVLPPPPEHGSKLEKADFDKIFFYQKTRTPKDCERAEFEVSTSLDSLFGPKYGPLTEDEVKKLQVLFEKVRNDTDYFVQPLKRKWNRPRPYLTDAQVTPCIRRETTGAYPSGHAAISRAFARVLDLIHPRRKAAFEARANLIGEDRVMGGVHHPADIAAGRHLGDLVFDAMKKSPSFEADVRALTGK